MRVAFVSGNQEKMPDAVIPLGLLYLRASLPASYGSELWDLCFEEQPERFLAAKLEAYRPEIVALGIRNLQRNDYGGFDETLRYYRRIIEAIRSATAAPVVLGGGGFSVAAEQVMRTLEADFGLSGEGERSFTALLELLAEGKQALKMPSLDTRHARWGSLLVAQREALDAIPRLHYWEAPATLRETTAAPHFVELDGFRPPDRGAVDGRYYEHYGIDSVQSKRGCAMRCDYCSYPAIEGRRHRLRDPVAVVSELLEVAHRSPPPSHVFVVDAVFNHPPKHAKAICREMIARSFSLPWTCYINPLGFDRELAELMVEAGCAGIEFGTDSGSDEILARLNKGFSLETVRRVRRLCLDVGLPDCHTFILGTPGESMEEVEQTLAFCAELDPFAAIMMIWTADEKGEDAVDGPRRRAFVESIEALLRVRCADQPRWIVPAIERNFNARQFRVFRRRGLRGPLWQQLPGYLAGAVAGD